MPVDGTQAGTFAETELGQAWYWRSLFEVNGNIVMTADDGRRGDEPWVYRPTKMGDTNGDEEVNFADFAALAENFGANDANREQGDLNNDNVVDFTDFVLLSRYFHSDDDSTEVAIDLIAEEVASVAG